MLDGKIGCLGPQCGRLPWATQQMTNDGRITDYCQKFCFERFLRKRINFATNIFFENNGNSEKLFLLKKNNSKSKTS